MPWERQLLSWHVLKIQGSHRGHRVHGEKILESDLGMPWERSGNANF